MVRRVGGGCLLLITLVLMMGRAADPGMILLLQSNRDGGGYRLYGFEPVSRSLLPMGEHFRRQYHFTRRGELLYAVQDEAIVRIDLSTGDSRVMVAPLDNRHQVVFGREAMYFYQGGHLQRLDYEGRQVERLTPTNVARYDELVDFAVGPQGVVFFGRFQEYTALYFTDFVTQGWQSLAVYRDPVPLETQLLIQGGWVLHNFGGRVRRIDLNRPVQFTYLTDEIRRTWQPIIAPFTETILEISDTELVISLEGSRGSVWLGYEVGATSHEPRWIRYFQAGTLPVQISADFGTILTLHWTGNQSTLISQRGRVIRPLFSAPSLMRVVCCSSTPDEWVYVVDEQGRVYRVWLDGSPAEYLYEVRGLIEQILPDGRYVLTSDYGSRKLHLVRGERTRVILKEVNGVVGWVQFGGEGWRPVVWLVVGLVVVVGGFWRGRK